MYKPPAKFIYRILMLSYSLAFLFDFLSLSSPAFSSDGIPAFAIPLRRSRGAVPLGKGDRVFSRSFWRRRKNDETTGKSRPFALAFS